MEVHILLWKMKHLLSCYNRHSARMIYRTLMKMRIYSRVHEPMVDNLKESTPKLISTKMNPLMSLICQTLMEGNWTLSIWHNWAPWNKIKTLRKTIMILWLDWILSKIRMPAKSAINLPRQFNYCQAIDRIKRDQVIHYRLIPLRYWQVPLSNQTFFK